MNGNQYLIQNCHEFQSITQDIHASKEETKGVIT